jgi:hypothetical protein
MRTTFRTENQLIEVFYLGFLFRRGYSKLREGNYLLLGGQTQDKWRKNPNRRVNLISRGTPPSQLPRWMKHWLIVRADIWELWLSVGTVTMYYIPGLSLRLSETAIKQSSFFTLFYIVFWYDGLRRHIYVSFRRFLGPQILSIDKSTSLNKIQ